MSSRLLSLAPLLLAALAAGCVTTTEEEEEGSSEDAITATATARERALVESTALTGLTFDHITPTGVHLMRGMVYWREHQIDDLRYPVARMCASNVSKALFLGGVQKYNAEAVYDLIRSVGVRGGETHRLPQPTKLANGTLDKRAFLAELNAIDNGHLPTGTIVAGCLTAKCDAMPGEQHVGMIGDVDADGTVWVWHNNWYRPENEAPGSTKWKPYMIYGEDHDLYLKKGLRRQWMKTPWLVIRKDANGKIVDAKNPLPAIDDLDPFGGGQAPKYFMTLSVIPELAAELHAR
ncbi:MAG: hypothetical protein JWP97_1495 [Labilithrix sp.]|nr:hypothetical protein [Labilithrix sp.]